MSLASLIGPPQIIVLLLVLQRLAELLLAGANARRLRAAGAVEHGAWHYPLFVLLHAGWLLALFLMVPPTAAVSWSLVALFLLLQAGRLWVIVSLGRFWTTRVLSLPEAPLVTAGPYRLCRHPNYLLVAGELLVLPLAFGAWPIAVVATALNLPLLWLRVRVEEAALARRRA
jgi:methyltransferase